jgi:hypothetical protein
MAWISKQIFLLLGVVVLMAALAGTSPAQVIVTRAPRIAYYGPAPVMSYYAPPVYYTPAPVVSYYAAPAAVSYYAPPAVSYYSPPAVVAATATTVLYRGILPWRTYRATTYGAAPAVSYYSPVYYYP